MKRPTRSVCECGGSRRLRGKALGSHGHLPGSKGEATCRQFPPALWLPVFLCQRPGGTLGPGWGARGAGRGLVPQKCRNHPHPLRNGN